MTITERKKLAEQIERWNDADEFTQSIRAISAVPVPERGYRLTLLLGRAYCNLAVLGDKGCHTRDGVVDEAMLAAGLDILRSIEMQGQNDPFWNSRMAYAHLMLDTTSDTAYHYAKRWLALDPGNPEAYKLVKDCEGYILEERQHAEEDAARRASLALYSDAERSAVLAHIERQFGPVERVIPESEPFGVCLDLCVIPPRLEHDYYTLVTVGMGAHRMAVPDELADEGLARTELLVNLPRGWKLDDASLQTDRWYWPISVMEMAAHLPIDQPDAWLGWGHTMMEGDEGVPFDDSTRLCGAILLDPGVFGEASYRCALLGGEAVNFYQLVPLYREEVQYKLDHGEGALLDLCPDESLEVIDPCRLNVVTDREKIAYDPDEMDSAGKQLAKMRALGLPADALAACTLMAFFLGWAMKRGRMGEGFLAQHRGVAEAVRSGSGPDLRAFVRDELGGRLTLPLFDDTGAAFAEWYAQDNRSNPYVYRRDCRNIALAGLEGHAWNSLAEQEAAYLLLPYTEQNRQRIERLLDERFAAFLAAAREDAAEDES